jgi:hypothetical protein
MYFSLPERLLFNETEKRLSRKKPVANPAFRKSRLPYKYESGAKRGRSKEASLPLTVLHLLCYMSIYIILR